MVVIANHQGGGGGGGRRGEGGGEAHCVTLRVLKVHCKFSVLKNGVCNYLVQVKHVDSSDLRFFAT